MDRCQDCNYSLAIHFRGGNDRRAGEFLGCPLRVSSRMGHAEAQPRVSFRIFTSRAKDRAGHFLATWADYQDDDGSDGTLALMWDLTTGEQWMGGLEAVWPATRRLSIEQAHAAREQLEYLIGGPVTPVNAIRKRTRAAEDEYTRIGRILTR